MNDRTPHHEDAPARRRAVPGGKDDAAAHDKIPADDLKWKMHGGLTLPKPATVNTLVSVMPVSAQLALALEQPKVGNFFPVVGIGDQISKHQIIARNSSAHPSCLHAPASGVVTTIARYPLAHPSGLEVPHIVIESDGRDHSDKPPEPIPWQREDFGIRQLCGLLNRYGVTGQGGGNYLSGRKMADCHNKSNHILIVNACECDPFIECDHALMLERAGEIVEAIRILNAVAGFEQTILGIEADTPDAVDALTEAGLERHARIKVLPAIYPIGNEKQLIYAVLGKRIGLRDHPSDVGIVCLNVGTIASIAGVLLRGQPVVERLITVAGAGISRPQNVWVRIGTPVEDIIAHCGGLKSACRSTIVGGKMTGFAIDHRRCHILRNTNALLFADAHEDPRPPEQQACIQCNFCQDVCPAELQPQRMFARIAAGRYTSADVDYHLFQCMECGCCDQVCPSHIPLTAYFRYAKGAMRQQTVFARRKRTHDLNNTRHLARVDRRQRQREGDLRNSHAALEKTPDARRKMIESALAGRRDSQP